METNTVEREPEASNFLQAEHERISREISYLVTLRLQLEGELRSALALRKYEEAAEIQARLAELTGLQIGLEEELDEIEKQLDELNYLQRQCVIYENSLKDQDAQIAAMERVLNSAFKSRLETLNHLLSVRERIVRITGIPYDLGEEPSGEEWADQPESVETETI
jgi:hypothetical protein